jgi:hypothetical protein
MQLAIDAADPDEQFTNSSVRVAVASEYRCRRQPRRRRSFRGEGMRFRSPVIVTALTLSVCSLLVGCRQATKTAEAPAAGAPQAHATLNQVMRGVLFPNSNVVFAAQSDDPAAVKPAADPSLAVNPLESLYGGWQAVENSGLAITEAANLLIVPGRTCSNGKPVPVDAADWNMFVQGLRDAGMASYTAAQAKNQDQILDASDKLTTACANCHNVYREKTPEQGGAANRCSK